MELQTFQEISKGLDNFISIDVALGMETSLDATVLLTTQKGFKSNQFFRLFGSVIAGNALLRNAKETSVLIPGGTRLCIYNSSQHAKSRYPYRLSLRPPLQSAEPCDDDLESGRRTLRELLRTSLGEIVAVWIAKVIPAIAASKLRAEVYFSLKAHKILEMKRHLEQLLKRQIAIVGCPAAKLVEFYQDLLNALLTNARLVDEGETEFSELYCILTTFRQIAGSIYADWQVTAEAAQFGVLPNLFIGQTRRLKLEVLLQFDKIKISKLAELFTGQTKAVVYCCLLLSLLEEICTYGSEEVAADWFGKDDILEMWRRIAVETSQATTQEREQLSEEEFLRLVRRKNRNSNALKLFIDTLKWLMQNQSYVFDRILALFESECQLSFQNRTYYALKERTPGGLEIGSEDDAIYSLEWALENPGSLPRRISALVNHLFTEGLKYAEALKKLPSSVEKNDKDLALR